MTEQVSTDIAALEKGVVEHEPSTTPRCSRFGRTNIVLGAVVAVVLIAGVGTLVSISVAGQDSKDSVQTDVPLSECDIQAIEAVKNATSYDGDRLVLALDGSDQDDTYDGYNYAEYSPASSIECFPDSVFDNLTELTDIVISDVSIPGGIDISARLFQNQNISHFNLDDTEVGSIASGSFIDEPIDMMLLNNIGEPEFPPGFFSEFKSIRFFLFL
mmetsp:Transcript_12125/g.14708  ORF Transcript_12125/g.14708 Transcript_12125/m.14708 type:complete len:215 (+) Transcript_12125:83-727(+)